MGYSLLINGVYWGYNPLTNHLLTSWDIQVGISFKSLENPGCLILNAMNFTFVGVGWVISWTLMKAATHELMTLPWEICIVYPVIYHTILLMAEILHHLGCMKPYKQWEKLPINWCGISAINSINHSSIGPIRFMGLIYLSTHFSCHLP